MKQNGRYTLEYAAAMKDLFGLLIEREKGVVEVYKLFSAMGACIFARRAFEASDTPESEALARWDRERANHELYSLMRTWCLLEEERDIIRSLVRDSI